MTKEEKEDYKQLLQMLEERKVALLKLADKLNEYQHKHTEYMSKENKAEQKKK